VPGPHARAGRAHLTYLVPEYAAHFNAERSHQALGKRPLPEAGSPGPLVLPFPGGGVVCEERLGGLLRHYRRAA
jgi:putative transposase